MIAQAEGSSRWMDKGMRVFPVQRPEHIATTSSGVVPGIEATAFGRERRRDGGGKDLHERRVSEMSRCQGYGGWLEDERGDYDLETIEGLAEAAFYGVMATPTIIVEDGEDNELAAWRGSVPSPQEIEGVLRANGFLSS
jgi:hypothetical protein